MAWRAFRACRQIRVWVCLGRGESGFRMSALADLHIVAAARLQTRRDQARAGNNCQP